MSLETLKSALPDYAKDLKLNLQSLAADESLSVVQRAGSFIASALASRNAFVTTALYGAFAHDLSPLELKAAETAAALMAMTNVYYRATHLISAPDYGTMPAKLRMNAIANPGAPKEDFDLWAVAVSAINGCGACLDNHERVLRQHNVTAEQIQTALRIAAVVHAIAAVLEGEAAKQQYAAAA